MPEGVTASSSQAVPGDKVEVVSTAIREALQAAGSDAYLRPIVTSHAINGDLEGALAAIKAAKAAQLHTSGAPGTHAHLTLPVLAVLPCALHRHVPNY